MTVEGILQFLGLVAFEIVVAILFNAFSTMQKRKLPYLICAISPLAAMVMFHSRYIGNDSLNYYNLFHYIFDHFHQYEHIYYFYYIKYL